MPLQTVNVKILPDGKVKIETKGFIGEQCYDITQSLNLGKVVSSVKTEEAYAKIPRIRRVNVGRK